MKQINSLSHELNSVINEAVLMDITIADRSFTWSNLQERLGLARLNKVFVSADWEDQYPLVTICTLPRPTYDHPPLCLDNAETCVAKRERRAGPLVCGQGLGGDPCP